MNNSWPSGSREIKTEGSGNYMSLIKSVISLKTELRR